MATNDDILRKLESLEETAEHTLTRLSTLETVVLHNTKSIAKRQGGRRGGIWGAIVATIISGLTTGYLDYVRNAQATPPLPDTPTQRP